MRGVRFTKAEVAALEIALSAVDQDGTLSWHRTIDAIREKLSNASALRAPGVDAAALERALEESARGKVIATNEGSGHYARLSRQATALGVTPEAARVLGNWIASQSWLTGPLTIFTVLNKWPDWLARARATAAPKGTTQGIGGAKGPEGNLGSDARKASPAHTAGRRPAGLGNRRED